MNKKIANNNNFCRNCGKSMMDTANNCSYCGTTIINNRVRNDKKYIYYVIANIICCVLSYFVPYSFVVALVLIVLTRNKYRGKFIVELLFWTEIVFVILGILGIVFLTFSCISLFR